jgi:hypothetical protein
MSKLRFLLLVSAPDLVGSSCQGSDAARHPLVPASSARPRFLMGMQMLVVAERLWPFKIRRSDESLRVSASDKNPNGRKRSPRSPTVLLPASPS